MKIRDTIKNFRSKLEQEFRVKKNPSSTSVEYIEMGINGPPKIVERRNQDFVEWGDDNLYPNKISDLKYGSPIHNAIIDTAAMLIAGDGFLIDGAKTKEESEAKYNSLTPEVKARFDTFLNNPNSEDSIHEITNRIAFDLKEQGGYSLETVLNLDKTGIATIKYVNISTVRAGKMANDRVENYWVCRDWSKHTRSDYKPKPIKAFDPKNTEDLNQLIFRKRGKLEYYPEPDYIGALTWTQTDLQMGVFHLANIENGMNPSMKIKFYKVPTNEDDKQRILDDIRKTYRGPKNVGKHMVFFSDGKELSPDVDPVQTSNLDRQLLLLAELCDKKILTGHKLTSPLLMGISISGQIGGNTELGQAFQIYDKTRIAPYRAMIAETYNKILEFNKIPVKVQINPFNPIV